MTNIHLFIQLAEGNIKILIFREETIKAFNLIKLETILKVRVNC